MVKKFFIIFKIATLLCVLNSQSLSADNLNFNEDIEEAVEAYNNGNFYKAIKAYKMVADSNNLQGYLNLAVIFKDLGYYEMAIKILEKAKVKFPQDLKILTLLGRIYFLSHRIDKAIDILNKILEIEPDDLEANINLGLCYAEKGLDSEAERYYQKAILLNRDSIVAHISLADLYLRKGKIQEASEEYRKVSLIDTSILNAQKILAELLFKLGNLEDSLRLYQKIILYQPHDRLIKTRIAQIHNRLGKEFFEKERQRVTLQRKRKKVFVKPFGEISGIPLLRIGLMQRVSSVEFKCSSPFEVRRKSGHSEVFNGLKDEIYLISKSADNKIVISSKRQQKYIDNDSILIKPKEPEGTITIFNITLGEDNFWARKDDRSYRGVIEIKLDRWGIKVINIVSLEEYLYSVVPSEMPYKWPKEALKAQSIVARTVAMKKLGRHKKEGFDLCAQVHCQVYSGVEQETETTNKIVDETRGIIMVYDNKPIDALYSSNCGGHTQDNIFGSNKEIPYLKGRSDLLGEEELVFPLSPLQLEFWFKQPPQAILCRDGTNFRWIRIYSYQEIKEILDKIADFGQIQKIVITRRNRSGHVTQLKIVGSNTTYVLEKELNIRTALGNLRSSMFKVEIKKDAEGKPLQFIFYGGGFGHGVGMCQSGAKALANLGKNYKEILNHYFGKEIEFIKLY
ncbi:MAG: SpoIID/LytB domain-containing protein [Candidatus Omnitrophica bacterium]|nr:SpoIID/LytB domain-containing protein [Candidatus Omnitrophota bacterium]